MLDNDDEVSQSETLTTLRPRFAQQDPYLSNILKELVGIYRDKKNEFTHNHNASEEEQDE